MQVLYMSVYLQEVFYGWLLLELLQHWLGAHKVGTVLSIGRQLHRLEVKGGGGEEGGGRRERGAGRRELHV